MMCVFSTNVSGQTKISIGSAWCRPAYNTWLDFDLGWMGVEV